MERKDSFDQFFMCIKSVDGTGNFCFRLGTPFIGIVGIFEGELVERLIEK